MRIFWEMKEIKDLQAVFRVIEEWKGICPAIRKVRRKFESKLDTLPDYRANDITVVNQATNPDCVSQTFTSPPAITIEDDKRIELDSRPAPKKLKVGCTEDKESLKKFRSYMIWSIDNRTTTVGAMIKYQSYYQKYIWHFFPLHPSG